MTPMNEKITIVVREDRYESVGNWDGARALFPSIRVDQEKALVEITYWSVANSRRGQWGTTHEHTEALSPDGQVLRITGMTGLRNDRRGTGGRQKFCFFVFRGDSGHLYTHLAVASAGWLNTPPEKLLGRLRKIRRRRAFGIQHPTVTVPAGQWIVGTTSQSLRHDNLRD